MILLSNLTAQTLQPGQSVTFNDVRLKSKCGSECFNRQLPTSVKLCDHGVYRLSFTGNVTSPTAGDALQLAIAVGGQPLTETAMNSTPSVANGFNNIHATTLLKTCCCDLDRVSVINTGAVPVTLAPNPALVITRES